MVKGTGTGAGRGSGALTTGMLREAVCWGTSAEEAGAGAAEADAVTAAGAADVGWPVCPEAANCSFFFLIAAATIRSPIVITFLSFFEAVGVGVLAGR